MAWEGGDGFDFHNAVGDMVVAGSVWTSTGGGGFLSGASTRFGVGQAYSIPGTGAGAFVTQTFGNDTTIFVNFAWNIATTLSGSTVYFGFALRDTTNNQVGVYMRSDGTILVTNGAFNGTVLATWTGAFGGNQWNHYQFKIVINNTTGSVEMRMNGATSDTQSVTGINTRNGSANNYANNISFYGSSTNTAIDDAYWFNDQGAQPNTWQGDVRAVQLMPASDSSVTWTPNSGANNYSRVSEAHQDGDTSYVSTNTINNVDLYAIAALATTPNAIINVALKSMARMDDAGPHTYKQRLSSGGTTSDSSNLSLSTTYQWLWTNYSTDPHTSAAWTFAGINAALIGPFDVA
jgi:hypothetical protein